MEPIHLALVSGAVGAATKEIVGKGLECGQKWLRDRFANHQDKVIANATNNANDFLNRLAEKVQRMEEEQTIDRAIVDTVLEDPSFSLLLQKSLLSAAETPNKTKHEMLAKLVADRIRRGPEDILSLCSSLAADAITRSTTAQLKMLALQAYLFFNKHPAGLSERERAALFFRTVEPFVDVAVSEADMMHLMSLSCVSPVTFPSGSPSKYVDAMFADGAKIWESLPQHGDVNPVLKIWTTGAMFCYPTSVGRLVGSISFDHFQRARNLGQPVSFSTEVT